MEEALKKIFGLIDDFLSGNYDPMAFSYDLPSELIDNLDSVFLVNNELGERLNSEFPEICAEYEPGYDDKLFKAKIQKAYDYAKEAL